MKVSDQVAATLKALHPDVRKDIRRALGDLDAGQKRDTKRLTKQLDGFWRLRIGKYRVIYRTDPKTGEIIAEFLDTRSSVYDRFTPPANT